MGFFVSILGAVLFSSTLTYTEVYRVQCYLWRGCLGRSTDRCGLTGRSIRIIVVSVIILIVTFTMVAQLVENIFPIALPVPPAVRVLLLPVACKHEAKISANQWQEGLRSVTGVWKCVGSKIMIKTLSVVSLNTHQWSVNTYWWYIELWCLVVNWDKLIQSDRSHKVNRRVKRSCSQTKTSHVFSFIMHVPNN